jgi:DNA-binding transcriptional regulator/RsmH inhibitor MraZ
VSSFVKSFYIGEHARSIDEKMRIALPVKLRLENEEDIFLALPNPIGCIIVYPPKMIARLEAKVAEVSFGDTQG